MLNLALKSAFGLRSPAGRGARLQILIFHRVFAVRDELFPGEVDRREFDALCGWLRQWLQVLPLDDAVRRLAAGSLPARAAAITFDDGYADNHDVALPVLRAHGLPATFFVATDYLDGGRMWNDTVIEAIRRCRDDVLELDLPGVGRQRFELTSAVQRRKAIDDVLRAIKHLDIDERLAATHAVADRVGARLPSDLMMSSAQVRALAAAGMQVGAHTASHPILARLSDAQARDEIEQGRAVLEGLTGRRVSLFAYPNGRPNQDYGARDVKLAKDLGFDAAVTTSTGAAGPDCSDFLQLPRFTPWDRTPAAFALRLLHNLSTAPIRLAPAWSGRG